jgi:RHH-type rel operon transcriptional repressor/antitoxin RelB
MRNTAQINIKEKFAKKIYKLSETTKKNPSYHVNKALENYFDEMDDLKEASKRLKDKNDRVISSKELRKSLGI